MTFTEDVQALHVTLRAAIALAADEQIDPVLKEIATEAYALGMKRGIQKAQARVYRILYTMTGMGFAILGLALLAGWTA